MIMRTRNTILACGIICAMQAVPAIGAMSTNVAGWDIDLSVSLELDSYYAHHTAGYPFNPESNQSDDELSFDDDSSVIATIQNDSYKFFVEAEVDQFEYIWGQWNFGSGTLRIGKDDPLTFAPLHLPPPQKSGIGQMIGYPIANQIKLSIPMGPVTLSVAAMEQDDYYSPIVNADAYDLDNELPVFEARIDFPIGPISAGIAGGYSTYTEVNLASGGEYDIDSYMVGLIMRYFNGPVGVHASIFTDHNDYSHGGDPRQKGVLFVAPGAAYFGGPVYDAATDSIMESDFLGMGISASYKFNDMFETHIGISGGTTEDDYGNEDDALGYEIATVIKLSDIVSITPFFHVTDWGSRDSASGASVDEGESVVAGIEWAVKL